ncbi:enolase C-terminal domain-like protein [Coraliomargarita algicola]|uniref:glucarate dehydratase n=1 Tax=Coraliomargarita algicola TaxID=3092156 RepID=A0ABZ0RRA8_9BACT|nr:enolase C-terminal domain-like protein [Coraliomargarita sp. J2-16]WPJ97325.1 enolase C-terminal domain-like protein [Coraliomargarita sp. J2-16]
MPKQTIEEIEIIPVAGYDSMLLNLSGAHTPTFSRILVIITDNHGREGIGEIPCSQSILSMLDLIAPSLRGQTVENYRSLLRSLLDRYKEHDAAGRGLQTFDQRTTIHAVTAIEAALLDLRGKTLGMPVCELLGRGKIRESIPFLAYLFFIGESEATEFDYKQEITQPNSWHSARRSPAMDTQAIIEQAGLVAETYGFKDFKLKGGVFAPEKEIEAVIGLSQTFPQAHLTLDPNGCWDLATALEAAKQLKGRVSYLEDPCGAEGRFSSREIMAEFRQRSGIPTATNMVATDSRELAHAIKQSAVDIPLADPHFWGMEGAVQVSNLCRQNGLCWGAHSNNHFDISLAMVSQVAAAAEGTITAIDTHWIWQEGQHLTLNPPKIIDGAIQIDDSVGLGVEIDRAAIQKAHALYQEVGQSDRDDSLAMQALIPNWEFDPKSPCMVR